MAHLDHPQRHPIQHCMAFNKLISTGLRRDIRKGKEADLYSAFTEVPYTQSAQVRITQCYLQTTPYLPLLLVIHSCRVFSRRYLEIGKSFDRTALVTAAQLSKKKLDSKTHSGS